MLLRMSRVRINETFADMALVCSVGTFKTAKNVLISLLKAEIYICLLPNLANIFFEWGKKVPFISIKLKPLLFDNENQRGRIKNVYVLFILDFNHSATIRIPLL